MSLPPAFAHGARRADAPRRAHYGRIFDVACCPWDDSLFATAGEDETARVWRDDSRSSGGSGIVSHGVCRGHKDEVVRVAWHPTMRILASGSADGAVAVWKVASPGAERAASAHDPDEPSVARVDVIGPHPGEVYGCAFVGDGEGGGPMLATAAGADLRLWDLEAAVEVARVPPVRAAKDGSDFRVPADASGPAKKKTPERWEGGHLFSLSSDGGARGLLASACSDGTVKLWGLDAGARAATAVASVASHPNDLPLHVLDEWDPRREKLMAAARDGESSWRNGGMNGRARKPPPRRFAGFSGANCGQNMPAKDKKRYAEFSADAPRTRDREGAMFARPRRKNKY